jgi:hypothetical protein
MDSPGWTLTTPLPRALSALRGVTVGGRFFITGKLFWAVCNILILLCFAGGGFDDTERDEIIGWLDEEQKWEETGKMMMARSYHAVTTIQMNDPLIEIYCNV